MNHVSAGNANASVVFPIEAFLYIGLAADGAMKTAYKGTPDTITAVLGGHVDFTCTGLASFIGVIRSGVLRPLVVSTRA